MNIYGEYEDYLKKLSKEKLLGIVTEYNKLCTIYGKEKINVNKKDKKEEVIKVIGEIKEDYFKYLVMGLDLNDLNVLKQLVFKKVTNDYLNANKDCIEYLLDKCVLFQENDLMLSWDVKNILKKTIKDKEVVKEVKKSNRLYKLVDGIIVAYGVVSKKYFDIIMEKEEIEHVIEKLENYYKKEYVIDNKKIMSNKLSNKKRISSYLKNNKYKMFTNKEFIEMGNNNYHHEIKCYKRFIKMLKNNYVFRSSDIEYVDKNIVIPYLYNSLNEEDIAKKNLEDIVINLFEFKGDKLKQKMLDEIMKIRDEFPLWEYRGFTKLEVNNEE